MEAKLRESEARLRLIMTQTPDYVIVVDRQCQCLYINKIAKGANRSDIVGQDVANFALSDYRKAVRDAIKSVFKTGLPQQVLVQGFGRNTGVCWYDIRIGALKAHGRVEELLIISSDVTERVVSEALVRDNPDLKQRYQRLQTPSRRPAK
jgi:PAS domain S-box-containing protein